VPHTVGEHIRIGGWRHLCFNVDNIDAMIADLKQRGVTVIAEPYDLPVIGRRLAHIVDHDGNVIEFAQRMSSEEMP
jgi:predicted enzyme related to lactoylglutathione lyase